MHPTFQVLERSIDIFPDIPQLLLLNPLDAQVPPSLSEAKLITTDYRLYRDTNIPDDSKRYGLEKLDPEMTANIKAAVVFMPKAKGELAVLLDYLSSSLNPGCSIFLVGEKKSGVESAAKKLKDHYRATKIDSAKHCQLWRLTGEVIGQDNDFDLDNWINYYTVEYANKPLQFASMPGVFSFERLDEGTQLLLETLEEGRPKRIQGRMLDFGCGSGVIAICAKQLHPNTELELVDINWFALQCSERSCMKNNIEARIYPSNGWSEVKGRVDGVLSNPPFHAGIKTEYGTSEQFIHEALKKTSKHAPMLIVANRFLKYPGLIEQSFGKVETVNQNGKFSVYLTYR